MTETVTHVFTFGRSHMTSYPLPPGGGRLADYWVEVTLPKYHSETHREIFLDSFANYYLPRPSQWGFEYPSQSFKPEHFPGGTLCRITEDGIVKE